MIRAAALALPVCVLAASASAETKPGLYSPLPGIEYYCRDRDGGRREIGEVMCITASCQTWTARCEMGANNNLAMWRKLQDGCPGASALPLEDRIEALKHAL
ncbi:hypothetical protein [Anianabacter salinae]|uniref:hypothetical protein n=1 Tax=Anianabacter salinae TaxID=2851023 RepID=UPI00225DEC85|nr:hypothetical protein [Anianabacter salinae]MBV0912987.1 hypothetical protein [Anianabacter salinae]